jgi:hypothetical protein
MKGMHCASSPNSISDHSIGRKTYSLVEDCSKFKHVKGQRTCSRGLSAPWQVLHLAILAMLFTQSSSAPPAKLGSLILDEQGIILPVAPGVQRERLLFPIVIQLLDDFDEIIKNDPTPYRVTVEAGGATLSGTTQLTAINGIATFKNLVIAESGQYRLQFNIPNSAVTPRVLPVNIQASFQTTTSQHTRFCIRSSLCNKHIAIAWRTLLPCTKST